jgi:phosphatidylinositol-3-phosphatase
MTDLRRCETCGGPLDAGQRYCLTCGTRVGERSPHLRALLARIGGEQSPRALPAAEVPVVTAAASGNQPLRLPGPWVSLLLVGLFLGFGALLGDAGAGAGTGRLSASAGPLKVFVRHPAAAPSSSHERSSGTSGEGGSEPPAAEQEPTPAPAQAAEPATGQSTTKSTETEAPSKAKPEKAKPAARLSDIHHVFLIVLSDQPYAADFGPESKARYLSHALEAKGELLLRYDAIAHEQLPNGIALLSGQGPSAQTAANCPTYAPLVPGTAGADEQVLGDGCLYPASVKTLPGQLAAKHLRWRAYIQGLEEAGPPTGPCAHPAPGAADPTAAGGAYATYRNPFLYFESITAASSCRENDVGLGHLKADLAGAAKRTPSLSYIVPDRCHDGGPTPCAPGAPSGPATTDAVLETLVPEIMASKAYKKDGLLVITTDEAPAGGELGDSSSCCGQPSYPNLKTSGLRHGGGVVGALLLSPLIKGATTAQEPYNHYSLLRTIEDIFGVSHLGYAALPAVPSLSASLLNGKG